MDQAGQDLLNRSLRTTTMICFAISMSVPIYVLVAWFILSQGTRADNVPAPVISGLVAAACVLLMAATVVPRRLKAAAATKSTLGERLEAFRVATIISFALREGIAVIGLVITLMGGDFRWCLGLAAVSLVAMFLDWPKTDEWGRLAFDPATAPMG